MRILLVHSSKIPVFAYGGTERVVWDLARALKQLGHVVDFCVPAGSRCDFAQVYVLPENRSISSQLARQYDIVHFHFRPRQTPDFPYLMTEHGNGAAGDSYPLNTVFLSANHAQRHGVTCFVYNGLDWSAYGHELGRDTPLMSHQTRGYCHFLAKAAWSVKNLRGAVAVARTAHMQMKILGGHRLQLKRGLRFTWGRDLQFMGMVGGASKLAALRGSCGLVSPVIWHEPFGLTVIESLYFGAPVFATPYGALPELVPANCGVLSADAHVLACALREHARSSDGHFDAAACHAQALRFHAVQMAHDYLRAYERVLDGASLNTQTPVLKEHPKHLPFTLPQV